MSDPSHAARSLRERIGGNTEERLGKALSDLLENPLLTGAIGRAFDAREKAAQAQEVALSALNIPSAADIERLTRRLRSVSHRLEGIEDGVDRIDRGFSPSGVEARLSAIEEQLRALSSKLDQPAPAPAPAPASAPAAGKPAAKATRRAPAKAKPAAAKSGPAAAKPKARTARPKQG